MLTTEEVFYPLGGGAHSYFSVYKERVGGVLLSTLDTLPLQPLFLTPSLFFSCDHAASRRWGQNEQTGFLSQVILFFKTRQTLSGINLLFQMPSSFFLNHTHTHNLHILPSY